jgi:predicted CoA-binding protein
MTDSKPTVAILGASRDPRKFGYRSVVSHVRHGYDVYPINPHANEIAGVKAYPSLDQVPLPTIERISVYLPAETGLMLLDQIAASESSELLERAESLGLPVIAACSLIDLESRSS